MAARSLKKVTLVQNDSILSDDTEVAKAFNSYFKNITVGPEFMATGT